MEPYGKDQETSTSVMDVFSLISLSNAGLSSLEKFEALDPVCWCTQGYASGNPDIRSVIN